MKQRHVVVQADQSLAWVESTLDPPGEHAVQIEVAAFGINRPDLLQRSGRYPPPPGASPVLGLEVAGTIRAVGAGVTSWRVGDRVCALVNGGGYSEHCLADADLCLPWPDGYSAAEAACLPEALFTVWHNLFERGDLQAGESVLIQAGSSGIGTTAIQLAQLAGADVITTAGSDAKCARCMALGARQAISYALPDAWEQLQAACPTGYQVILDVLGGAALAQHVRLAAVDGRIVQIAVLDGSQAGLNLAAVLLKRLWVTGSTLRAQPQARKAAMATRIKETVWPWISSGSFRPVVDSRFAPSQVETAHAHMQARAHFGKIAIDFSL